MILWLFQGPVPEIGVPITQTTNDDLLTITAAQNFKQDCIEKEAKEESSIMVSTE